MAVAAVSAMTPVSASGAPAATPGDSSATAGPDSGTDLGVDETAVDQSVGSDLGDSNVYNVIQTVAIAPGSGDFQIYVVQGGDSLSKIAAKFGLSRNTIYWANTSRLPNPSSIRVGLKLLIPPADGVTVTVKANNTVSGLASKYKVSTQKILVANSMSERTPDGRPAAAHPRRPGAGHPDAQAAVRRQPGAGTAASSDGRYRATPRLSQGYWSGHRAIDIAAPTGTPVVAAVRRHRHLRRLEVRRAPGYGGGLVVWISHGGTLWTTYNHLSAEFVHVGQVVKAGQRIGSIGMTGNATGPHLHFEVWACYPWTGLTTACARNPLNYF